MNLAGRPVAAFDPDGLIFAAGVNSEHVKLYDLRYLGEEEGGGLRLRGREGSEGRKRVKLYFCNSLIEFILVSLVECHQIITD